MYVSFLSRLLRTRADLFRRSSRPAQKISSGPSSLFTSAFDHPFITILLVVLSWVAMWFTLKWCMKPIAPETANAKYD